MTRAICIGLLCAFLASGQGKGYGKGKGKGQAPQTDTSTGVQFSFGRDGDVIRQYCRNLASSSLPPGLAKRGGNLPPGLEKQLRRNGRLPPGLQERVNPFPADLERRLPPLPPIYRRGTVGDQAVIYDSKTMAILDIIRILTG